MIARTFLAGASLDTGDLGTKLFSMTRFFRFLASQQKQDFLEQILPSPPILVPPLTETRLMSTLPERSSSSTQLELETLPC